MNRNWLTLPSTDRQAVRARRGFTLIELLAVILIIGILMTYLLPKIPEAIDRTRVTACKSNMQAINQGLVMYVDGHNGLPNESGVKFFAALIYGGTWQNDKTSAQKLTCPGINPGKLALGAIEDESQWFSKKDEITGDYSAYAGRDNHQDGGGSSKKAMNKNVLGRFPGSGTEAIVADDNEHGDTNEGNHRTATVVLYADGSVQQHDIFVLKEKGKVDAEVKVLKVGPESPLEELRKLSLD